MMAQEPKPTDFSSLVRSLKKKTAAPATGATSRTEEKKNPRESHFFMLAVAYTCTYVVVRHSNSSIVFEERAKKTKKKKKCYFIKNGIDSSIRDLYKSMRLIIFIWYHLFSKKVRKQVRRREREKNENDKPSDAIFLDVYIHRYTNFSLSLSLLLSRFFLLRRLKPLICRWWSIPWKEIYLSIGKQIKYVHTTFAFVIWVSRWREKEWKIKKKYC